MYTYVRFHSPRNYDLNRVKPRTDVPNFLHEEPCINNRFSRTPPRCPPIFERRLRNRPITARRRTIHDLTSRMIRAIASKRGSTKHRANLRRRILLFELFESRRFNASELRATNTGLRSCCSRGFTARRSSNSTIGIFSKALESSR